ncbi:hypothetical protein [Pseudalgibacter alginicilyticus]|nr:hypothetical protein [Pseudalgibacter alginicilyticus]
MLLSMASQNIIGKVYDNESTAKGIEIINITQNTKTFSNEHGDFVIKASLNDSLVFQSLFHLKKSIKISEAHFGYKIVIELKKSVNELGEVLLNHEKNKTFNTQNIQLEIAEDIKRNLHKYQPQASFGGVNHFFLIKKLFSVFIKNKSKNKNETPIKTVSYRTFDSLFSKDSFFNKKMLKDDLQISEELKPLFFGYCDAQNLDSKLLEKDNQFFLLDSLINFSNTFKTVINESKKE